MADELTCTAVSATFKGSSNGPFKVTVRIGYPYEATHDEAEKYIAQLTKVLDKNGFGPCEIEREWKN